MSLVQLGEETKKRSCIAFFLFSYLMWFSGILFCWRSEQPTGFLVLAAAFSSSYLFYRVFPPAEK